MRRTTALAVAAPALAMMAALSIGSPATAGSATAQAQLQPINDEDASGQAFVDVQGNKITVTMAAQGLVADQPHAAHIHFGDDARHECPTFARDDANHDHRLTTVEGVPAYGPVAVSLTEFGATDPGSALAISRFDTAPGGELTYQRGSIKVSRDVSRAIQSGEAVVVVHGVDYNEDGQYNGEARSDLDPSLPAEATDPAICGVLDVTSSRGVR
jgi:hypothetical protein